MKLRLRLGALAVMIRLLVGCLPVDQPLRPKPSPIKTAEQAQEAQVQKFLDHLVYQALLDFAAAIEYQRILAFAAAVEAHRQQQAAQQSYGVWDRLAQCESGGRWNLSTGNGYYGGIQFSLASWRGVGGTGYPHQHSRETQIAMGERLRRNGGWGHWPACSRKLGLR